MTMTYSPLKAGATEDEEWGPINYELSEQLRKEMLALEPVGYMPPIVNGKYVYKYPPPIRCHFCRKLFREGHIRSCPSF